MMKTLLKVIPAGMASWTFSSTAAAGPSLVTTMM